MSPFPPAENNLKSRRLLMELNLLSWWYSLGLEPKAYLYPLRGKPSRVWMEVNLLS